MKTIGLIVTMIFFSAWTKPLPEVNITGTVYDVSGNTPLAGVNVTEKGTLNSTATDAKGAYAIRVKDNNSILVFSMNGYKSKEIKVASMTRINIFLEKGKSKDDLAQQPVAVPEEADKKIVYGRGNMAIKSYATGNISESQPYYQPFNTEDYSPIEENIFHKAMNDPLSTFSIDVDAASYSNVRRFITAGQLPPKDAIRIEEMINYFHYSYAQPSGEDPFSINTETASCPWNKDHWLVQIGLQGKNIPVENLPPSNLVFLLDVSGSMDEANKLPLVKSALRMLVDKIRPQDRIAIVVYAGAAGLVLPSTPGDEKEKILNSLEQLQAGGSTAGGEGIRLAYKVAQENFMKSGNNRIILATDGDFNVGASSNGDMERLIEQERQSGVYLTVLGFGMGNYKDSKMEILADKGNGNYAYIDNILEAKKVFINEFGGTLFTIAKDVKIQVEFNPAVVQSYRLVGYEDRKLNNEDFNNDKKDAGELGAGHTVTAIYEIIPVGAEDDAHTDIDPLKYQEHSFNAGKNNGEIMTVKLRYKKPDEETSRLITHVVKNSIEKPDEVSENLRFSSAVASFGMLLRDSEFKGNTNYDMVIRLAKSAKGSDDEGYRAEFIKLAESAELLAHR